MTKDTSNLYKPIKLGRIELGHRIAAAPVTRHRATDDHVPTPRYVKYYNQRASYPGTLIITEATLVSAWAGGVHNTPGIWNKEQTEAWKPVLKGIHDQGSKVFLQLWSIGHMAEPETLEKEGNTFVGPSAVTTDLRPDLAPREITRDEIKQFKQDYVNAAKNSIEAGADGVEIHAANSYFLDQFLHANTNQRTDEYGGSIENRARIVLEIVDDLIEAVGADRLAIRFSPWSEFMDVVRNGISPVPQFSYLVSELERRGVEGNRLAYLSLVEPRVIGNVDITPEGSNEVFEHIWTGIVVKAGGLIHVGEEVANKDDRTIIAYGRYFISNPDLVLRLKNGWKLNDYDRSTFYHLGDEGYADYPFYEGTVQA